jgi:energy-coupling factor transporter ATP-binding protein EcfA2
VYSPQSEAAPLVVENLTFRYRSRPEPALNEISFELHPGEVMLVAGASGSGKTTLIRCVNGLIPRSYRGDLQGKVLLFGEDAHDYSLAKLSQIVGTVLQDPEKQILGAHVKTEVSFGPENLGLPLDEVAERVNEALTRLGLLHLRDRETFSLSGGEKQKVALAGALAMRPAILLLDEPLASLDPASAREALATFRRLADEGTSILLIEHRVEDALAARPDRVLYISDTRVHYLGPPDGLGEVVDWREVKLPAPQAIQRIRAQEKEEGKPPRSYEPPTVAPTPSQDRPPLIQFENVSFHYEEGAPVLHDINLEIGEGERVALLGPNGAGKSTLVKHAIGLLKPRQGRVLISGKDTRQLSVAQIARTLGYVFQSPSHMLFAPTVNEELAFGPRNIGQTEDEIGPNVAEAVKVLNLGGLEEYPPLALSFGQQKRVTIACVAAMHSRILALDEPTAGQDFGNYMAFMDTLLGMGENGGDPENRAPLSQFDAVIFITHDLDLAVTYASRAILLADGRVAADGPPEKVLNDLALLDRCRIVPTSLLAENLRLLPKTGRFLPLEALAGVGA